MPNLRETRISLLYSYDSSIINDEEFVLLYDINTCLLYTSDAADE